MNTHVSCPRCGYDLAGEVVRWSGACPIEGCCSECGLIFLWGDLFCKRMLPNWFIESSSGVLGGVRRFPGTFLRMIAPMVLWKRVRIEECPSPMRFRAYLGWVIGILLVAYLGAGLVCGSRAAFNAYDMVDRSSSQLIWNSKRQKYVDTPTKESPIRVAGETFVFGLVDPFGVSKRVGGVAWELERVEADYQWGRDQTYPFWWLSLGPDQYYRGMRPNAPSRGLIFMWVVTVVIPSVFLVLPVTRKRAKVRAAHILRLFLLSLMAPFATWMIYCFAMGSEMQLYLGGDWYALGVLIPIILLLVFWRWGCRDFLRLSSSTAVFFSIAAIGLLAGAVSMVITEYGFRYFDYLGF